MAGRKTKLTEDFIKKMRELLKKGATRILCCNALRVSEPTFYSWVNDAELIQSHIEAGNELAEIMDVDTDNGKITITNCILKLEFLTALNESEADFFQVHIDNIARAGKTNWQASAWLLERRRAKEFGRKSQIDVANADEKPFKVDNNRNNNLIENIMRTAKELEERDIREHGYPYYKENEDKYQHN